MQSAAGHAVYRERAATIESVNTEARRRTLTLLPVRGSAKVRAVALWHALAYNLAPMPALPAEVTA